MRTYSSNRLLGLTLAAGLVACGGSDLTLPTDGGLPSQLDAISGDGQQGTVGAELPDPIVVRLTDGAARPISGVPLRFQTEVPAAQVEPATVATNDSGYASARVRLGATEGTQMVEARLADDPASDLSATFGLTALAAEHPDNGGGGGDTGDGHGDGHGGGGEDHDHDHGD